MHLTAKSLRVLGIVFVLTVSQAWGQGVLNRRTLGNLAVPQLGRGSITPLSSSIEEQQLQNLTREQQIQLALLQSSSLKNLQGRLPGAIAEDSTAWKEYVRRSIFRDTLVFGSELFRLGKLDFAPSLQLANAPDYLIGVGDKLVITLYGQQEAAHELEVSPNGTIVAPYAGVIPVAGLTFRATEALLKQKFIRAGYTGLQSGATQLSLGIQEVRSIRVSVVGGKIPGSYVVPAIATVMHVLYQAGGPAENGSYRQIELVRQGQVIKTLDLYRFIASGDLSDNAVLQEGDVIRIPYYQNRINLMGEFKRPGLYEVLEGESLSDLMTYAGSFTEGAFKKSVLVFSTGESELYVEDLMDSSFTQVQPQGGDVILAMPLRNRYVNRIALTGGVVRPGYLGWEPGLTFTQALSRAHGLDRQALTTKGILLRRPDQGEGTYQEFNPSQDDFTLAPNDSLYIGMYADLQTFDSISVQGRVAKAGRIVYFPGITAEQALLMAGGVTPTGDIASVEVANPIVDDEGNFTGASQVVRYQPQFEGEGLPLQKGATITVRERPNLGTSNVVYFTGAVTHPGAYALSRKGERLDQVFKRVGTLSDDALPRFGLIIRTKSTEKVKDLGLYQKIESVLDLDSMSYVQEEFVEIQRKAKDSIAVNFFNVSQLKRIGLEDGDTIYLPRELNIVMVRGAVKNTGGHAFVPGRRAKFYLHQSGGFKRGVNAMDVLVEYANGQSAEVRYILGLVPVYPRVYSNTTVTVIPRPKKKDGLNAGELAAYTSSLASISSITLGLIYLLRP